MAEDELEAIRKRCEQLRCALMLIAQDEAFVTLQGGSPFFILSEVSEHGEPAFSLHMGDTFAYASADCEPFSLDEAPELLRISVRDGWYGLVRWVAQRRGVEPIPEVKSQLDRRFGSRDHQEDRREDGGDD